MPVLFNFSINSDTKIREVIEISKKEILVLINNRDNPKKTPFYFNKILYVILSFLKTQKYLVYFSKKETSVSKTNFLVKFHTNFNKMTKLPFRNIY